MDVITILDNEESAVNDNALDDFSASELPERNERFKLDYSAILDKSNRICEDNCEIETVGASTSKSAKIMGKKRILPANSTKNKCQRY